MPISVVFDPPLPSDSPSTFNTKAFTLLGDLNDWSTQANALPGEVATNLSALLAAPPAIGSTTPAAGSFTTLSTSGGNQAVTSYSVSSAYLICTTAFGVDVGPSLGFYGQADGGSATQFGNISARKENATSGNTAGYLSFATRVHGSTPTEKMRISSTGAVTIPGSLSLTGGTFGYGTGAGVTVTQTGSRTAGVTANKPSGSITLFTKSTTAGLVETFTVTNSFVAGTDTILLSMKSGSVSGSTVYIPIVSAVSAGSFNISIYTPAAIGSEGVIVNFAVIKGANA